MERVYASSADYDDYVGKRGPDSIDRRSFVAASRHIDRELRGAVYATDAHGMPTDPAIRKALRDATCAQVEAWVAAGDPTGTGAVTQFSSVSIGDVTLTRRPDNASGVAGNGTRLAEKAITVLMDAGLLPIQPWLVG